MTNNELVIDGENGFLFDKTDNKHFIDSLEKLYKEPGLRKIMGEKGAQYMEKFVIENPLQQTIAIYEKYIK